MGGSSGEVNAGVYCGAGALIDEGVVSKYFHGFDGSGEAGSHIRGHLHRGGYRAVVVRSGDGNATRAGEGGSQIIRSSVPMLEEGDDPGSEDEDDGED